MARRSSNKAERGLHTPEGVGSTPAAATTLNTRQLAFVQEYLKDRNATAAYIRAGYKSRGHAAESSASTLLRHREVQRRILEAERQHLDRVTEDTGITIERTIREIGRIAFFDPRKLFDNEGRPLSLHQLDDETAAVVAGLDVNEERDREGELTGVVKKWKLADKKGALDMLMRRFGAYLKDNEQKAPLAETPILDNSAARDIAFALQLGLRAARQREASNDTTKADEPQR